MPMYESADLSREVWQYLREEALYEKLTSDLFLCISHIKTVLTLWKNRTARRQRVCAVVNRLCY